MQQALIHKVTIYFYFEHRLQVVPKFSYSQFTSIYLPRSKHTKCNTAEGNIIFLSPILVNIMYIKIYKLYYEYVKAITMCNIKQLQPNGIFCVYTSLTITEPVDYISSY
jgi:hypothetical protein